MKIIIQRVNSASIVLDGVTLSAINRGLLLLVGIDKNDTKETIEKGVNKILKLKLWECPDSGKLWSKSVVDMEYEILVQSQFTLHAILTKGNKPDFHNAMKTEDARQNFDHCVSLFRTLYNSDKIQTGQFGGFTGVLLENDGPTTFILE